VIGVDLGSRRIGVAVSDASGSVAGPLATVERTGDLARDHRALADLVAEEEAEMVVVGLPLSPSGRRGPAARAAEEEIEALAAALPVPVETWDERFTTVEAGRTLVEMKVRASDRRKTIDKMAAAVMLQSWLDARGGPR
jgi:putative holliday junction resolvase